jgi:ATP/ADP translocase/HEAT repeat protein
MERLKRAWRGLFDIRPGEYQRTVFMSLYMLMVLFAYYILKSASESLFLNKFDIDKLPVFYIMMAVFGGALAMVYSKAAARSSLHTAVTWTLAISIICLVIMWFPLRSRNETIVYVFAVWVRLFSVVVVTQGWVVASNLFNSREAKRVYGLLGMGMVVGAISGGEFTNQMVKFIGTNNLLFASAPLVALAYVCYLIAIAGHSGAVRRAKASESEEQEEFSFKEVASDIFKSRHLQALMFIMAMQFMVDTLIDYQFKYMAKQAYKGDALTAFLGRFYGRYLNITELVLQFFFTTAIVRRLGVGGTMQIMPISLAAASLFTFSAPSVLSASLARLVEASTRYTLARTGNELFYMPLPIEIRNRIKAFVDIFMDRAARGVSGLMLILFAQWSIGVRGIALITFGLAIPWIAFTVYAHREYVRTIRRRLEARRLDLENVRVRVEDADTIRLLENTAMSDNPRQAVYALNLLASAQRYDATELFGKLASSPHPEVRAEIYRAAAARGSAALVERARQEVENASSAAAVRAAVVYVLAVSPDRVSLYREWLEHPNPNVQEGVVESFASHSQVANEVATHAWIAQAASDPAWERRLLAAHVVGARGDQGTEALHALLADPHPKVAAAAAEAAGKLKNRAYVFALAKLLANYQVRGVAIESLALYGAAICGTLGDMLDDPQVPLPVRVNIPRVLKRIPHQRSVDLLLEGLKNADPAVRMASLKGLTRLRETSPGLTFSDAFLKQHIINEAHRFYELSAAISSLKEHRERPGSAVSLLARSLDERLRQTLDRLFRLMGLRYKTKEMYWTYLALSHHDKEKHTTAVEYLDNVLDQDLKRVVLPMFDAPDRIPERGRALFGVEAPDAAGAVRDLLQSDERWVVACAMAAAGELKIRELAPDITQVSQRLNGDIAPVAQSALANLA